MSSLHSLRMPPALPSSSASAPRLSNITYDFEDDIVKMKLVPDIYVGNEPTTTTTSHGGHGSSATDRTTKSDTKFRTMVCRHWLLGLCQKWEGCGFLHQIDRSKAPICKYGKQCKIKNCQLRHIDEEEMVECIFYKQGFCYNGPNCKRRHVKLPPDECPKEATFEQAVNTTGGLMQNPNFNKNIKSSQRNENYKVSLCSHWLMTGTCHYNVGCHYAHGEEEITESLLQTNDTLNDLHLLDPTRNIMLEEADPKYTELGFNNSNSISYFLTQSPDLRSLAVAKRRGVWVVPAKTSIEINEAVRTSDHVLLFFFVRPLKGFYGVAKVKGLIPTSLAPPAPGLSPEFSIQWLRTCRLTLRTVAQLKTGASLFIGRALYDIKLDNIVGPQMLMTFFRKPQWDWSTQIAAAEEGIVRFTQDEVLPTNPDQIFSQAWMEKIGGKMASSASSSSSGSSSITVQEDYYKLDFPGFIFTAAGPLIAEMFQRSLFGLPANMKDTVIHPGAPIFLLDIQQQLLFGLYQAVTPVTENLDPSAFVDWERGAQSSFLPLQVRFQVILGAPPIYVATDPDIASVFNNQPVNGGPLDLRQTKQLANIFAIKAGVMPAPGVNAQMGQSGVAGGGGADSSQPKMYRPPHKFVEIVLVDMPGVPLFEVKKRILGNNGSVVLQIANEVTGGNPKSVRIRIRGIGSGFFEGPEGSKSELQEPLHFNVCAETEELLHIVAGKVKELVSRVRNELMPLSQQTPQSVPMMLF